MGFNWEKGLLGAGVGALSGYDYMLKNKMKEEYETRMEEARSQRAENLQIQAEKRQQAYEKDPTNPKYQLLQQQIATSKNDDTRADKQLGLSQEQFQFNKMNADRQYGLEAARTNASIAASNRNAAESDLSMRVKELQLKALEDPTAADIANNTKIADWRYNKVIESGGTPEQAAVEQAMVVKYGITKIDDVKTMYAKDPEGSKATREFIGKAVLESKKDIDKIKEADPSGESILKEYFTSTGKKAASVAEAENGLLQHKAVQAASVYESMTQGRTLETKSGPNEDKVKTLAMENEAIRVAKKFASSGTDSLSEDEFKKLEGIREGYNKDKFSEGAKKALRPFLFQDEVRKEKEINKRNNNTNKEFDINTAY